MPATPSPAITTITANPAIDVSASVDEVLPFQKLRCGRERRDPGGGGINVARILKRWNRDVTAVFPAGGTNGELLKRLVEYEGILQHPIPISGDTREDVTIFETRTGNQFRFVFPGSRLSMEEWHACCDALSSVVPKPGFVVASGSLPPESPSDLYAHVVRLSKRVGARSVVDTSGAALREALNEGVYLAKPNLRELSELVGRQLTTESDWLDVGQSLVAAGKAEILALTLGDKGAIAVTREGVWRARAPRVQVVSTVGAGDSFLGAMLIRLSVGSDVAAALRYGVAAGTAALLAPGTDLARPADTERLLADVAVKKTG